jgi:hypothetical protein
LGGFRQLALLLGSARFLRFGLGSLLCLRFGSEGTLSFGLQTLLLLASSLFGLRAFFFGQGRSLRGAF